MPEIVLSTLNAKYIHAAFGLRYLMANLGELQDRAELIEFNINQRPLEIVEKLVALQPRILGLGVYIWNAAICLEVVKLFKQVLPDCVVVLGGPEVSFETDRQEIIELADHVITGEADLKFAEVCQLILDGQPPGQKVIPAPLPAMESLRLPYHLYNDEDIAHRVVYVEASRGCPFTCEFCLSSLDVPVRQVPLEKLFDALDNLFGRGVRQFKFVDRTFNLNLKISRAILEFFLERLTPDLFLHFEMIPDRLPPGLRELIAKFPPGVLQFEVGIQTFDDTVSQNISRRQNLTALEDNFHFLRRETGVHIHADLIVGLPGETIEMFAAGFDRLVRLRPQEIQVGILKRLRGTPIIRHDAAWEMVYSPLPPYEILQNKLFSFDEMARMRRFARFWDLTANSGNFTSAAPLVWNQAVSPFYAFLEWTEFAHVELGRTHGIAKLTLAKTLFNFLTQRKHFPPAEVAVALWSDLGGNSSMHIPGFLQLHLQAPATNTASPNMKKSGSPKRQARHLIRDPCLPLIEPPAKISLRN